MQQIKSFGDSPLKYLAHRVTAELEDGSENVREQSILEHLTQTSNLAAEFAEYFGSAQWASLAGLWHDLGKYSSDFQKYIRGNPGRVNHSSYGALVAKEKYIIPGRILAYIIAGHHAGLPDCRTG